MLPNDFLFFIILAAISAFLFGTGVTLDCSTPKPKPVSKNDSGLGVYQQEAIPFKRTIWVNVLTGTSLVVMIISIIVATVIVRDELGEALGTPRTTMEPGRYRMLYRLPDGSGDLIKSLDDGQVRFYASSKPIVQADPTAQFCFENRRVGCNGSRNHAIACPAETE